MDTTALKSVTDCQLDGSALRHGNWKMYGLNLPDEVLKKVYYKNALNLFPHIKENKYFKNLNN